MSLIGKKNCIKFISNRIDFFFGRKVVGQSHFSPWTLKCPKISPQTINLSHNSPYHQNTDENLIVIAMWRSSAF